MYVLVRSVFYSTALRLENFRTAFPQDVQWQVLSRIQSHVEISHMT